MSRRYERDTIIVTSSRGFDNGSEVLGDGMVAAGLIDRLVHHATMITLKGARTCRIPEAQKMKSCSRVTLLV